MNNFKNIIIKLFLTIMLVQASLNANDKNLDLIMEQIKETDKHLFILLTKTGCSWCDKMKKSILKDDNTRLLLEKDFLFEFINISKTGTITFKDFEGTKHKFSKYLGHNFYPTSVFINKDYEIVFSQPGIVNNKRFLLILEFIKSKSYLKCSLQEYIDEQEF